MPVLVVLALIIGLAPANVSAVPVKVLVLIVPDVARVVTPVTAPAEDTLNALEFKVSAPVALPIVTALALAVPTFTAPVVPEPVLTPLSMVIAPLLVFVPEPSPDFRLTAPVDKPLPPVVVPLRRLKAALAAAPSAVCTNGTLKPVPIVALFVTDKAVPAEVKLLAPLKVFAPVPVWV